MPIRHTHKCSRCSGSWDWRPQRWRCWPPHRHAPCPPPARRGLSSACVHLCVSPLRRPQRWRCWLPRQHAPCPPPAQEVSSLDAHTPHSQMLSLLQELGLAPSEMALLAPSRTCSLSPACTRNPALWRPMPHTQRQMTRMSASVSFCEESSTPHQHAPCSQPARRVETLSIHFPAETLEWSLA